MDPGEEALAVDGPIEQAGGGDPIVTQGGEEGHGRPSPLRCLAMQRLTALSPAMPAGHVRLGPGLVDEHQTLGIDTVLIFLPPGPPSGDLRPILFAGEYGFF